MITRRDALIGTAALVTAGSALAQGAAPELTKLSFGFGIDPPFAPHIVAMQKGWFREAGFTDVQTKSFSAGALAGEALVTGDIHLWTPGNLPPISMAHNGAPVVVIGTNCVNWSLEKLTVRRDANITKPEDLYRIKIGLLQGSTSSAFLYYLAKHYGLDEKRLQVVNLPPPEQLASLLSNAVQGLICWEPWPVRALQSGETVVVHTCVTSGFAANAGQRAKVSDNRSIWVVSQDFARKNPRTVQAMMRVMVRAQRYVADPKNTEEAIKLFSEFQKQDPEINRKIWGNYVFTAAFDDAYVADMEHTAEFLEATGRIKKRINVLDYTYSAPLAAIDAALVKVPGRWKG
ncbi:MAG: ABC transporter substrate-binding protein [Proteobacteria bacterium]|nr:ABC transporter substrate-binding protein [Pseudomonadota bacterium]